MSIHSRKIKFEIPFKLSPNDLRNDCETVSIYKVGHCIPDILIPSYLNIFRDKIKKNIRFNVVFYLQLIDHVSGWCEILLDQCSETISLTYRLKSCNG